MTMATTLLSCNYGKMRNEVIVENEDITVTSDSVTIGSFTAYSPDGLSIITNYITPGIDSIDNVIKFRILTGGRDIELLPAHYHYIDLDKVNGNTMIKAFEHDTIKLVSTHSVALPVNLDLNIDMSHMTKTLNDEGYYVTPTRDTIYRQDFEKAKLEVSIRSSISSQTLKVRLDDPSLDNDIYSVTVPINPRHPIQHKGWTSSINTESPMLPTYSSGRKQVL